MFNEPTQLNICANIIIMMIQLYFRLAIHCGNECGIIIISHIYKCTIWHVVYENHDDDLDVETHKLKCHVPNDRASLVKSKWLNESVKWHRMNEQMGLKKRVNCALYSFVNHSDFS